MVSQSRQAYYDDVIVSARQMPQHGDDNGRRNEMAGVNIAYAKKPSAATRWPGGASGDNYFMRRSSLHYNTIISNS